MTVETVQLDTGLWLLIRGAAERCMRGETDRQDITWKKVRAVVYGMKNEKNGKQSVRIDLHVRS